MFSRVCHVCIHMFVDNMDWNPLHYSQNLKPKIHLWYNLFNWFKLLPTCLNLTNKEKIVFDIYKTQLNTLIFSSIIWRAISSLIPTDFICLTSYLSDTDIGKKKQTENMYSYIEIKSNFINKHIIIEIRMI